MKASERLRQLISKFLKPNQNTKKEKKKKEEPHSFRSNKKKP